MRDLIRRRLAAAGGDRGGIGVLVAIFFSTGVFLGIGALVVDVGLIYVAQSGLQNGAEAGALAVARSCASGGCDPSLASGYVAANNPAGARVSASDVCGTSGLNRCPDAGYPVTTGFGAQALDACPPVPAGQEYAQVTATTPTGSTLVPMIFARALLRTVGPLTGSQDRTASTRQGAIGACARARWGSPASAAVTGLTVPMCDWQLATGDGTMLPPAPSRASAGLASPAAVVAIGLGGPPAAGCGGTGEASGSWIAAPDGICSARVSGAYPAAPVSQRSSDIPPPLCALAIAIAQANRSFLVIPVYTGVTGAGGGTMFQLAGFAAFVVTGYRFGGLSAPDWLDPAISCGQHPSCVTGYFARTVIPGSGSIGGPDLGASIVTLAG